MSDIIDQGNENAELFLQSALSNRRAASLAPVGHCYYCDETVQRGVLFCSADCRDDWQREDRLRRISGKA